MLPEHFCRDSLYNSDKLWLAGAAFGADDAGRTLFAHGHTLLRIPGNARRWRRLTEPVPVRFPAGRQRGIIRGENMKPDLFIKRMVRGERKPSMPAYQTKGGCGPLDLSAFIDEPLTLSPGTAGDGAHRNRNPTARRLRRTGVCPVGAGVPAGGWALMNGVGLIDEDYRGEILVCLYNGGQTPVTVQDGDRIAQLMIVPAVRCAVQEAGELSKTARGAGGFGSTGVLSVEDKPW